MATNFHPTTRQHPMLPGDDSDEEGDENDADSKAARAVDVAVVEVWEPTLLGGQQVGVLGNGLLEALSRARSCGLIGGKTQVRVPRRALQKSPIALKRDLLT